MQSNPRLLSSASDDPLLADILAGLGDKPFLPFGEAVAKVPEGRTKLYSAIKPADPANARLRSFLIHGRRYIKTIDLAVYIANLVRDADAAPAIDRSGPARRRRRVALDRQATPGGRPVEGTTREVGTISPASRSGSSERQGTPGAAS